MDLDELLAPSNEDNTLYNEIIRDFLKKRTLVLNGEICDDQLESICLMILKWNSEDIDKPIEKRKPIKLFINSDGGDAIFGDMLLSAITSSKTPVYTVGFSMCASMASYVLAAGKVRYAFPNTVVLVHDGSRTIVGSGNKSKDIQKFLDRLDDRGTQFFLDHTKMTKEFLEDNKDREYYMFSDEAKELGLIDKIIGQDCELEEIL